MDQAEPRERITDLESYWPHTWQGRYAFALLTVAIATGLRFALQLLGPFHSAFVLFYPAVVLVAMRAGFWPGLFATVLASISGGYFFEEPRNTFAVHTAEDVVEPALFAVIGVALIFLTASRNRARQALAVSQGELNRAQAAALEEMKQAESALSLFRSLLDQSNDAIQIIEPDSLRLLDVNERTCVELGYSRKELLSMTIYDIAPSFTAEMRASVLRQLKESGFAITERVHRRKDGSTFPVEVTLREAHLDRTYGVSVSRDITARKQAEAALRESEASYRDLVENSEDLLCTHDLEGRLLTVNPATARILGYEVHELLKIPMRELIIPEGREAFDQYLERLRTAGQLEQGLLCVIARNGGVRTWEYRNTLRTEGVATPIVRGMAHDITEKRKAELALVNSEQRYRMLFEKNVAGVAVARIDGVMLECNPAWARIVGYDSPQEICGRLANEFYFDPDDRKPLLEELQRSGAFLGREVRLKHKDGSPVWVFFNAAIRRGDEGEALVQATAIDITEYKQAEEALRQSEQRERVRARELETILDTLPVTVMMSRDPEYRDMKTNRAGLEFLGLQTGQNDPLSVLPQQKPYQLFFPDGTAPQPGELPMERARATGRPVRGQTMKLVLGDGRVKYVLGNAAPLLDEQGKVTGVVAAAVDITERVASEEALRESEQRMRLAQEVAHIGIYDRDLVAGEARWSPEMEEIYGVGPGNSPKSIEQFLALIHPDDRSGVSELLQRSVDSGEAQGEWRVVWPDGSVRWIAGHWRVLCDGKGKPIRAIGMDYDITERKRADEALRQSEERFRVALKDSPITVFNQDSDLRYTWVYNPRLHWQDSVIGKTDEELVGAKKAFHLNELKRRVLNAGTAIREEVVISHEGTNYPFDLMIEPLFDAEQKIVGITGVAMDIARLRELLDGLQMEKGKLIQEKSYLEGEIQQEFGFEEIIGQNAGLKGVLKQARVVAATGSSVLLLGETGTGKELVARSIHSLSLRKEKNFIKLNCAAVPSGLLESELFGHEKGAFTGAVNQKPGRLELADKGTLFLDEIGELPLELQPKLLRVLQDREFERLGGVKTLKVDVRIISATNRDLRKDVADKKFREDLYYRLNVFPIQLPALRERRSDIPMLVRHFVQKHGARMGKQIVTIPDETLALLQTWNWPGNIRELENMIERMVILSRSTVLAEPPIELEVAQDLGEDNLTEMEREHIIRILRETNGVLSGTDGAASRLGIKRTTLQSMLKRFGIEPREYKRGSEPFGPH